MKSIRLIIAGLVMTMGFTGCSSLFYDAKADVLNSIQKGMSKQEVTRILGTPKYRRFDRNIEEWEFVKELHNRGSSAITHIVVNFEDDKVVAMDSFSDPYHPTPVISGGVVIDTPAPVCIKGMHPEDFKKDDAKKILGIRY